ncbi:MAG: hypothetical protein E6124_16495 [Blautia producta]|uniref:hypothetical protein n=1 Tax=Blautia producta TaxID=33035 RepID=UPI0029134DB2|nr:hypothetical protein [Blautia producta]MDU5383771.1 hypothetical protein [Blautia producta]MDU6884764.1 hypothetical protein [Blautia producta]
MKAKVVPIYFHGRNDREVRGYEDQLARIEELYGREAKILPSIELGGEIPQDADAVLFPQLFGAVFRQRELIKKISLPILIITSEFGTVEMWDWEIVAWLRDELSKNVFFPYNAEMARVILRAFSVRKSMQKGIKFLMFQDDPGEGMQVYLFKKFYWWNESCTEQIEKAFGIHIVYKSWKEVNKKAGRIEDSDAWILWEERKVPQAGVSRESILKAVKLYMAIKEAIEETGDVHGVGANCLNESFHSCTTPCLAWNWIYEYDHIIWACEGDTVTMISEFIIQETLKAPMMMTNIYPFLIGMAALKHEKIQKFPDIEDPDNHALGVHCGYFGFAPQSFCSKWMMRPKVLEIVNEDAVAIDCEMEKGPVTMAKLRPDMKKMTIIEAEIEDYVQYPGSDCRNGALLKYSNGNGHRIMESLSSHHAILIRGRVTYLLQQMCRVLDIDTELL